MRANPAGDYEFHGANIIICLFSSLLFLGLTIHTVLRVAAGEAGGWLIYIEPVIFIASARAFFRSGREYLRERGRARRLLTVLDFIARHYLKIAVAVGCALLVAYGIDAAVYGGGVYFFERARVILFIVGAFVALNVYLDQRAERR